MDTPWLDPLMVFFTTLGLGAVQAAIALAVLAAGIVKGRAYWRRMGYAAIAAYGAAGVLSQVVKSFGDRPRPPLLLHDVRLVVKPLFVHSFPSGHTTTAFAAAIVWAAFFPRWRWVFFAIAALVGLSRVYVGVHFPFDVVGGALLGTLIGICCARIFGPKEDQRSPQPEDASVLNSTVAETAE